MPVKTQTIPLQTKGNADILDITEQVMSAVNATHLQDGTVTIFCPSATSALTTIEYEPGCISDLRRLFDEILNPNEHYAHNARWGDGNGHSHVRAALLGPSLTVPVVNGRLTLGVWQQIIYVDFDNRSRRRELIVQLIGETETKP
ncbi:MAG: YjbQ family protein [Chloroflexi bacterium]|nr:YjbQ family protein [Chloroflexota bacterium]